MPISIDTNVRAFEKSLKKLTEGLYAGPAEVLRTFIPKVVEALVLQSPVGDETDDRYSTNAKQGFAPGYFWTNWQVGFNGESIEDLPNQFEGGGDFAIESAERKMQTFVLRQTKTIQIENPVDYAALIESGQHSAQAPSGVIGPVEQILPSLLEDTILEVDARYEGL